MPGAPVHVRNPGFLQKPGCHGVAPHLSLASLEEDTGGAVRNVHFTEVVDAAAQGEMRFDYLLRDGPVVTTNALRLMNDGGIGRFQGWNSGVLQAEFASDGRISGAYVGDVPYITIGQNGLSENGGFTGGFLRSPFQLRFVACHQREFRPRAAERDGHRFAQSSARAGNQGNFSC